MLLLRFTRPLSLSPPLFHVPFCIILLATIVPSLILQILIPNRQVLTNLLGFPSRVDWKTCTLDEEEDRADAEAFKAGFGPFVTWT